jgi:hypothetical protein
VNTAMILWVLECLHEWHLYKKDWIQWSQMILWVLECLHEWHLHKKDWTQWS